MGRRFNDRVVWITGASAGIGRELALAFAAEGARVALSARRADRLQELARAVEERGGQAIAVPCDVTDEAQIARAVEEVVRHFGRLDVAVANAGYGVVGSFESIAAEEWGRQFEVNVIGLALTARYAIPHLKATRGRLALVGSAAAMIPGPQAAPYAASKAAVRSIGQTLSVELHGSGVTCTTIHPGFVESDIARVDNAGVYHPDREDRRPRQLLWPADRAARRMVRAIGRREREYVFTGHGKIAGFLGRHSPGLVHFALTRPPALTAMAAGAVAVVAALALVAPLALRGDGAGLEAAPPAAAPVAAVEDPNAFRPGVREVAPGKYVVNIEGHQWDFEPREIRVPVGAEVTFRGTSTDETHGFIIGGTGTHMELVRGEITEVTHTFTEAGEYQFVCTWYCGTGHTGMMGHIIVE